MPFKLKPSLKAAVDTTLNLFKRRKSRRFKVTTTRPDDVHARCEHVPNYYCASQMEKVGFEYGSSTLAPVAPVFYMGETTPCVKTSNTILAKKESPAYYPTIAASFNSISSSILARLPPPPHYIPLPYPLPPRTVTSRRERRAPLFHTKAAEDYFFKVFVVQKEHLRYVKYAYGQGGSDPTLDGKLKVLLDVVERVYAQAVVIGASARAIEAARRSHEQAMAELTLNYYNPELQLHYQCHGFSIPSATLEAIARAINVVNKGGDGKRHPNRFPPGRLEAAHELSSYFFWTSKPSSGGNLLSLYQGPRHDEHEEVEGKRSSRRLPLPSQWFYTASSATTCDSPSAGRFIDPINHARTTFASSYSSSPVKVAGATVTENASSFTLDTRSINATFILTPTTSILALLSSVKVAATEHTYTSSPRPLLPLAHPRKKLIVRSTSKQTRGYIRLAVIGQNLRRLATTTY